MFTDRFAPVNDGEGPGVVLNDGPSLFGSDRDEADARPLHLGSSGRPRNAQQEPQLQQHGPP